MLGEEGRSLVPVKEISHSSDNRPTGETEVEMMIMGGATHPDLVCLVLNVPPPHSKHKHHVDSHALKTLEYRLSGPPVMFVSRPHVATLNKFSFFAIHSESLLNY